MAGTSEKKEMATRSFEQKQEQRTSEEMVRICTHRQTGAISDQKQKRETGTIFQKQEAIIRSSTQKQKKTVISSLQEASASTEKGEELSETAYQEITVMSGQKPEKGDLNPEQKHKVTISVQKEEKVAGYSMQKQEEAVRISALEKRGSIIKKKDRKIRTSDQRKEATSETIRREKQGTAETSDQQQGLRAGTSCQKGIVRTPTHRQEKTIGTLTRKQDSVQKQETVTKTLIQKKEKVPEVDAQKQELATRIPKEKKKRIPTTSVKSQESAAGTLGQKQERITETPVHKEGRIPIQKQERTTGTPVQKQGGTPMQERVAAQKQRKATMTLVQKQGGTTETLMQKQTTIGIVAQKQEETTFQTQVQKKQTALRTPVQKEKASLETPVQKEETSRGTPVQKEETSRGTPVQEEETSLRTPVQKEKPSLGTPVQKEETSLGTPVQKEKASLGTPVQKEETSLGIPVQKEETSLGIPVQKEEISETPAQIQGATKNAAEMQESDEKLPDTSKNKKFKRVSTAGLLQIEQTVSYVQPSMAQCFPPQEAQLMQAKMQIVEGLGGHLHNQVPQQYGSIPVVPFPQQTGIQIVEAPMYRPLSAPPYPVQPEMQMVETRAGPLYSQVPQQYDPVPFQSYSAQPEMQMVETRAGPLYSQVLQPQQYGPFPVIPQFPHPVPNLSVQPMTRIPAQPLPGQVIPQFPQAVPGPTQPITGTGPLPGQVVPQFPQVVPGMPTQPITGTGLLPGQVVPQFPQAVPGMPTQPITGTGPLPGQVVPQFSQAVPGMPTQPITGTEPLHGQVSKFSQPVPGLPAQPMARISESGQVLQQFGASHSGQFQPATRPFIPVSGYAQCNFQTSSSRTFPESDAQQFLDQIQHQSNGSRKQEHKQHDYKVDGLVVTEVTLQLCEPTITLSVARDKPTDPKIDPEKKNGTEKKTERELTTHVEFIYGQNSMMRVEVPGTEGTWQQPKIKLWPRSRKHRRDKLVIRHQAQMIEELFLHGPSDLKNSAVGCSDEKLEASLENMPQKVLIKIFELIAKEQNNNPNISVYNMYRLKLVCRRFNDVLENNTKVLPRYEVCGLRIQSKKVGPLGYFAMVYRYGTGAFEPPCACLDLTDIPSFLRHDIINGFIYIDKMELTDRLFITLNELTYAENVQKIVFSKISSVNLTPESGICTFLDKFPNLLDLWFFGYYEESELGLDHSQVVMQMQRSERGNGILTRKDMESMIERLKYKRKKRIKRSGMRAAVQNKARVQKKEAIQSKTRYIQNKTGNRNKAGDQSKTRVQSKIEVQSKERTQSKTRIRNETEIQSKTTGKSNPQKKNA